ncbi:hypothetical protein BsWGS_27143 [Bradybaena similaris]
MTAVALVLVSVYVWVAASSWSGPAKDDLLGEDEVRDIEKFVGDIMGCANIPGLALTVIRGDAIFSTGLGVANMATGHPVDKKTLFNLGSTSKAFVPYVLAEIMNGRENHDGRIKWNSTLKDILRHDRDLDLPSTWTDMTLKDMLIFKSGSSAADMTTMAGLPLNITREEMLRRIRFLRKTTEFRNSNHYSNFMYTVAGHLAERISGMNWAALVKSRVFDRLSMDTSSFVPEGMVADDSALAYRFHSTKPAEQFIEQDSSLFNLHPSEPVGSIMTSAEDISKWLHHLLHNLNAKGNNTGINMLISDAMHLWASLPSDHRDGSLRHASETINGYGMGWIASSYRGQRRFKFAGHLYGYRSQIWLFPDAFCAIFVAINGPGMESAQRAFDGIMYHIADVVLRKSAWVDTDTACCCGEDSDYNFEKFNDHNIKRKLMDQKLMKYMAPVEKYVGVFGNGLVGNLNITLNEAGILVAKIGRNLIGELTPSGVDTKLYFAVYSPLINTDEWYNEKPFEFFQNNDINDKNVFNRVRIYLKEHLYYEFQRGVLFETLLELGEENDRKQNDDAKITIQNDHGGRSTKFGYPPRKTTDVDKEKHGDESEEESLPDDGHEGHQTHMALNMDGQGDEPHLGKVKGSDASHGTKENDSTSQNTDSSSSLGASSCLLLLLITLHIMSKV